MCLFTLSVIISKCWFIWIFLINIIICLALWTLFTFIGSYQEVIVKVKDVTCKIQASVYYRYKISWHRLISCCFLLYVYIIILCYFILINAPFVCSSSQDVKLQQHYSHQSSHICWTDKPTVSVSCIPGSNSRQDLYKLYRIAYYMAN